MRRLYSVVLLSGLLLLAAACTSWLPTPPADGTVRITIRPATAATQGTAPKEIPGNAEKVRIRIWHAATGYNNVTTVALLGAPQIVDIPIPSNTGYTLDAVSYYNTGLPTALTGGRTDNVNVAEGIATEVQVALREWNVDITGPDTVPPETDFTLDFIPTDGGGLLTRQAFDTATLRSAANTFQNPGDPLPAVAGPVGIAEDYKVALTGTSPPVAVDTPLFIAALVQFNQGWYDYALPDPNERPMFVELPNRHMGKALHEILVEPGAGGIVVEITGAD